MQRRQALAHGTKIILASGSPRRKMLLESLGVDFQAVSPNADETFDEKMPPADAAQYIARKKADEVIRQYPGCAIIAADTIVVLDDAILGKPANEAQAYDMLCALSGKWHEVITGICIAHSGQSYMLAESTKVRFRDLSESFINWYIATKEPMDKAGAYGIQGYGSLIVDRIEGDFYNVMGFPVSKIMGELDRLSIYKFGRG
jgi:septum formation protein